jgi:hypothetical protein
MDASEVITSLKELAIAIRVLKKYPEALEEFKTALGASKHPTPEVLKQDGIQRSYI